MKQMKVKNPRYQSWFDYWTGWKQTVLILVLWAIAIGLVLYARSLK